MTERPPVIDAEWTDPKAGVLHPDFKRRAYKAYVKVCGAVITVMLLFTAVVTFILVPLLKATGQLPH